MSEAALKPAALNAGAVAMFALHRHQGETLCAGLKQGGLGAGATLVALTQPLHHKGNHLAILAMLRAHAGCPGCWGHTGGQDPSGRVCILPQWGKRALRDTSQSCLPRQDPGRVVLWQCGEPPGGQLG